MQEDLRTLVYVSDLFVWCRPGVARALLRVVKAAIGRTRVLADPYMRRGNERAA